MNSPLQRMGRDSSRRKRGMGRRSSDEAERCRALPAKNAGSPHKPGQSPALHSDGAQGARRRMGRDLGTGWGGGPLCVEMTGKSKERSGSLSTLGMTEKG